MTTSTAEAEALLEAASPGPWTCRRQIYGKGYAYKIQGASWDIAIVANTVFEDEQEANGTLAALAPKVTAWAIAAVKALEMQDCGLYGPAEECSEVLEVEFALDQYCPRCKALADWSALRWGKEEGHE